MKGNKLPADYEWLMVNGQWSMASELSQPAARTPLRLLRDFLFPVRTVVSLLIPEQILLSALLPTAASQARLRQVVRPELDWLNLVRRAEFNYVAPLLRYNLAACGLLAVLPAEAQRQLEQLSQTWAARHLAYVHEAERLLTALSGAHIPAIPLKGAALMLGGIYPQPGLRPAVDMDLLVDPAQIGQAEQVAEACGYAVAPGRTQARPRQRLANELNHVAPRRGSGGLLLELHTRAFHFARAGRDLGFAEIAARARPTATPSVLAPAPADLALHLVHHTLVDLQSTRAILRTLADLHFLWQHAPEAKAELRMRAEAFGFAGAVESAIQIEQLLAEGNLTALQQVLQGSDGCALLLETALLADPLDVAEAARLVEYFDFSRAPFVKLGNLAALLFTNRTHLAQLYGQAPEAMRIWHYWRRPFDLVRKFNWAGLQPGQLRRVRRLRKLARRVD
jgi:hypothetical protein